MSQSLQKTTCRASNIKNSDQAKVSRTFELLGNFVTRIRKPHSTEFQMFVLEHVPVELFQHVAPSRPKMKTRISTMTASL
ncbi:DUF3732 domain-containing protein [Pseudomonas putida]|uniref:DUF3732 domain-containing protein n=1 Tax=Pseudomonas putida TaxID=303 RepID=UPI0018AAD55D|nr:DUF3732 domain-containing protein [Pseudomonas putida]MBF8670787.1 DUF3732 domain-containing protein [Pseudomonas putida]MBF8713579.1 DUF3732 domain-containing protein [Pseudomonas putida]